MNIEQIRKSALECWLRESGRLITKYSDSISETYECRWMPETQHVSLFCSLACWAGCLTQVLSDDRYDSIDLDKSVANSESYAKYDERAEPIYLYHVRILLIVSEILSDLEVIYLAGRGINNKKKAREFLSSGDGIKLKKLHQFINTVIKHKIKYSPNSCKKSEFHRCNSHLLLSFKDVCDFKDDSCYSSSTISIDRPITEASENIIYLEVPSLLDVIEALVNAYKKIDYLFESDNEIYERVIEEFRDTE